MALKLNAFLLKIVSDFAVKRLIFIVCLPCGLEKIFLFSNIIAAKKEQIIRKYYTYGRNEYG